MCPAGSNGCPCTWGGSCDSGSTCEDRRKICVEEAPLPNEDDLTNFKQAFKQIQELVGHASLEGSKDKVIAAIAGVVESLQPRAAAEPLHVPHEASSTPPAEKSIPKSSTASDNTAQSSQTSKDEPQSSQTSTDELQSSTASSDQKRHSAASSFAKGEELDQGVIDVTVNDVHWAAVDHSTLPSARKKGRSYPKWDDGYIGTRYHGKLKTNDYSDFPTDDVDDGFDQDLARASPLDKFATDSRNNDCMGHRMYKNTQQLPDTSVVIVFRNEFLPVLLRTVASILNRSPPHLLKEIILVDDASDRAGLGESLDRAIQKLPKVKLIRLRIHKGLIVARSIGFDAATGKTLTILDSHCEVQEGWLEPLMSRIGEDRTVVAMPVIGTIKGSDLSYRPEEGIVCCAFFWNMKLKQVGNDEVPGQKTRKDNTEPIACPGQAGGLWSMDREFYYETGGYDLHMHYWGGENVEMSMRVWMCGGRIEVTPCSQVYHIFREKQAAYTVDFSDTLRNQLRAAYVWTDKHFDSIQLLNIVEGQVMPESLGPGLVERAALREKMQCKSFDWYLKNVLPMANGDAYQSTDTMLNIVHGRTGHCLDAGDEGIGGQARLNVQPCHYMEKQAFSFYEGSLRHIMWPEFCVDVVKKSKKLQVVHTECNKANQRYNDGIWRYNDQQLIHTRTEKCLTWSQKLLFVAECKVDSKGQFNSAQVWSLQEVGNNLANYKEQPTGFRIGRV